VKLTTVYVVRDPGSTSTLADIVWCCSTEWLARYIAGCGVEAWAAEQHTLWTTAVEADEDARARMAKRDAARKPA
jgi:hypothetical protein